MPASNDFPEAYHGLFATAEVFGIRDEFIKYREILLRRGYSGRMELRLLINWLHQEILKV